MLKVGSMEEVVIAVLSFSPDLDKDSLGNKNLYFVSQENCQLKLKINRHNGSCHCFIILCHETCILFLLQYLFQLAVSFLSCFLLFTLSYHENKAPPYPEIKVGKP